MVIRLVFKGFTFFRFALWPQLLFICSFVTESSSESSGYSETVIRESFVCVVLQEIHTEAHLPLTDFLPAGLVRSTLSCPPWPWFCFPSPQCDGSEKLSVSGPKSLHINHHQYELRLICVPLSLTPSNRANTHTLVLCLVCWCGLHQLLRLCF